MHLEFARKRVSSRTLYSSLRLVLLMVIAFVGIRPLFSMKLPTLWEICLFTLVASLLILASVSLTVSMRRGTK